METKDPNLIKTPLNETTQTPQTNVDPASVPTVATDTVPADTVNTVNTANTQAVESVPSSSDETGELVNTEHVNEGDLEARSPDRRDQVGQPFDGSINEQSVGSDSPQSEDLDTFNRYANVDNAQTRVLSLSDQKANRHE